MRRLQLLILLVLFVTLSMSSCECRKQAPLRPEADTQPKAGFQLKTITPRQRPTMVTPAAEPTATVIPELPTDFPAEVPVFEGANLAKVHKMPNEGHNVIFTSGGSVKEVKTFYYQKLRDQGFLVTQEIEKGKHVFATFKKGDLLVNMTVAEDERNPGQQIIAIMYEREKPLPFDEF